jgi:membrane associated rhomboid family serine protease
MAVGFRIAVGVDIEDFDGFVAAVSGIGGTRLPLAPLSSRRLLAWSAIWIALNVVLGVAGFGMGLGPQAVAWQAHIGGYLAGLLLAGPAEILSQRLRPVRTWLEPGPPRHK